MFVGHYGVSFAVKSVDKQIPLWMLFIAVQFVDVLWGIFILSSVLFQKASNDPLNHTKQH
jgi:hypothetical protein